MLKTCFLPTYCTNFSNKSCGEIICQSETLFIIVCKICDIKNFNYDEFVEHFRNTHWTKICNASDNTLEKISQTQNNCNNEWECNLGTEDQSLKDIGFINTTDTSNVMDENIPKSEVEESSSSIDITNRDSDSESLSKPLTILKKKTINKIEKPFQCIQCKRQFSTKFYLRFHIRQQHEPKHFQCDKCRKSFVEKRYLTLHQRSHIGYTCQICNKVFDKYEALRYHGESHIQSRNFICDYKNCGKAFPNNRRLSTHKRSHFIQPSFVCEICGSRQRSKEYLNVHIRTHTGEKPYPCNKCDRRFASKHFLQDHQSVHATERSHVCTICSKAFASSKSLYHHRHLHSNIKKFVCKICNNAFSQAAGLSAHMRKHKQVCSLMNSEQTAVSD